MGKSKGEPKNEPASGDPRPKSDDRDGLVPQPAPDPQAQSQKRPQDESSQPSTPRPADPKLGGPDHDRPEQDDATGRPRHPTGTFERADTSGRWGMLPPKEAEDLQRRNAAEFPQRYRLWMDLYFRRLNALDRTLRER